MILERTQDDIAWVPMHQLDAFQKNYSAVSAADGAHSSMTVEQMHPSVKKLQDHARRKSVAASALRAKRKGLTAASSASGSASKMPPVKAGGLSVTHITGVQADERKVGPDATSLSADDGPNPLIENSSLSLCSPQLQLPAQPASSDLGAGTAMYATQLGVGGVGAASGGSPAVYTPRATQAATGSSVNPMASLSQGLMQELALDDTE